MNERELDREGLALQRRAEALIDRLLEADAGERAALIPRAGAVAEEASRLAADLGHSRAFEMSPWISKLELMAAKVSLVAFGPGSAEVQPHEGAMHSAMTQRADSVGYAYERFKAEHAGGEGLLDALRDHWAWAVGEPLALLGLNALGEVLVEGGGGAVWWVIPSELRAQRLTWPWEGLEELPRVLRADRLLDLWGRRDETDAAREALGPLQPGECYAPRELPVQVGSWEVEDLAIWSLSEWIAATGDRAARLAEEADRERWPDGDEVD